MEVLMSDRKIENIIPYSTDSFQSEKAYLWVWHADKIPPHLGLSTQSRYYSLKSNGKDQNVCFEKVIQLIDRKKIKTLAIELDCEIELAKVDRVFETYKMNSIAGTTCLSPIKDILGKSNPSKLQYLLDELELGQEIVKYIGFNIDDSYKGIPYYTEQDILSRLELLANDA